MLLGTASCSFLFAFVQDEKKREKCCVPLYPYGSDLDFNLNHVVLSDGNSISAVPFAGFSLANVVHTPELPLVFCFQDEQRQEKQESEQDRSKAQGVIKKLEEQKMVRKQLLAL